MYSSVLLFTAYSPAKFTLSILYCSYFLGITFMKIYSIHLKIPHSCQGSAKCRTPFNLVCRATLSIDFFSVMTRHIVIAMDTVSCDRSCDQSMRETKLVLEIVFFFNKSRQPYFSLELGALSIFLL